MEDINIVLGADSAGTLIPTKTSQLINDSGYVVDPNYVHTDQNFTTYLQQTLVSKNCQIALNWLLGEEPDVLDTMKKTLGTFENDPDKQDKPEQAVAGNIAVFDKNKNTIDSGIAVANIVTHISLGLSTHITFDNLETKRQEGYIKANTLYSYSTEDNYTGTLTYDSSTGSYCLVYMNGQDVKIRGIYAELDTDWVGIQKQLVFDETPKQDSSNPVTSKGIYDAIQQSVAQETERAKQAEQLLTDTTLKNTGDQTLTGSLTINGDLTVSGTTTITETESLVVHDNLIVTNSEGAPLSDLSGLAIRTDETGVYGIVYDPTSESVKLGRGTLSEHNELSFLQDEGSAIAVREDSSAFVDGHLIQWDAQKTRLVDGGEKPVIPTTLPNPKTLTAGSKVYDGAQDIVLEAADFDAITAVSFAGANLTKQGTSASITQEQARTALGLGSAAYTESTAYATSAQGTKIDSIAQKQVVTGNSTETLETATEPLATQSYVQSVAQKGGVQSVSLESGTNNGTLKLIVDGTETDNISVAGLQSAAYTSSSDYATAAQGQTVDSISQKTVVTSTQESVTLAQVAESLVSKSYADAEQTRATNAEAALSGSIAQKAPIAHASAQTTYGTGTADLYGHVKLSDSTTSTSAAQNGTAATPVAVKTVNDALTSEISRAQAAEQTLSTDLQAEVTRATQAEAAHTAAITTLNDKQVVLSSGSTEDLSATEQIIATKQYVDASSSGGESQINSHIANKSNPHEVTAQQIGLGNVANVLQYSEDNPPPYPVTSVAGRTGAVTLTKTDVGLGNVQNVDQTNASNITSGSLAINRIAEGLVTSSSLSLLGTDIEVTRTENGVYEIEAGDGLLRTYGTQSLKGSLTIVKEGDTSTGNLVVQGDLTVQGTTTTTEAESLVIHDNLIVTNSEGAELTNLSGVAIKVDGTNTYGIVYDPVSQSVKLGEGTLSENNELTFNSNEGTAVATRSDSIALTDGNLLQWDGTRNIIVDGGAKPTALPNPYALTLGSKVYNGSSDVTLLASDINAEPAFEKNTAFNKNFGTTADTVAQGNDSRITGAVQSAAFAGAAFTKTGTTLEITQTAARTALGLGSAAYTNSDVYATAVDLQTTNSNVTNASGKATPQSITQTSGNTSSTQGHTHSMTLTKEWFANSMNADSADIMILYGGKADGTW